MVRQEGRQLCAGKSLLAGFPELLFRRLLLEDLGNDTVELAADALLPLILAHLDAYQSLGPRPPLHPQTAADISSGTVEAAKLGGDSSGRGGALEACCGFPFEGPRQWSVQW